MTQHQSGLFRLFPSTVIRAERLTRALFLLSLVGKPVAMLLTLFILDRREKAALAAGRPTTSSPEPCSLPSS